MPNFNFSGVPVRKIFEIRCVFPRADFPKIPLFIGLRKSYYSYRITFVQNFSCDVFKKRIGYSFTFYFI